MHAAQAWSLFVLLAAAAGLGWTLLMLARLGRCPRNRKNGRVG